MVEEILNPQDLEMNSFLSDVSAQSDITVKVMDACVVFSDDKGELP